MQQRRLNAYLKLIQELLTCPRGEEWIRLKQSEELVDSELLQVMEQIASQLLQEGNREAAVFLHNWAAKLHHILVREPLTAKPEEDNAQAYGELIQALLGCTETEQDILLAEHRDLIGPGLVQKMHQVSEQLKQQGSDAAALYLQHLANDLNQAWIEAHAFRPSLQKETAKVPTTGKQTVALEAALADEMPTQVTVASTPSPQPLTTALPLNQQLADAIADISRTLQQLNQTITAQNQAINPLWYMDVLERAALSNWLLTTEEIEQLIGIKPKCHGKEKTYQRGTWTFVKAGKLGAQTAWRVTKTQLKSVSEDNSENSQPDHRPQSEQHFAKESTPNPSPEHQPPLNQPPLKNGSQQREQLDRLEMEDVWA